MDLHGGAVAHHRIPAAVFHGHVLQDSGGAVEVQAVFGLAAAVDGEIPENHPGPLFHIYQIGAAAAAGVIGDASGSQGVAAAVDGEILRQGQYPLGIAQPAAVQHRVLQQRDGVAADGGSKRIGEGRVADGADFGPGRIFFRNGQILGIPGIVPVGHLAEDDVIRGSCQSRCRRRRQRQCQGQQAGYDGVWNGSHVFPPETALSGALKSIYFAL